VVSVVRRDRFWERLDFGHHGSRVVVESACHLERVHVVGRIDEDGRGTPLTQPASHCVESGLPSRVRRGGRSFAVVAPSGLPRAYRLCVAALLQVDVSPLDAQVVIIDATWQDYPQWETGEEWVAYRAPSLICSDRPPYPGFAVATQGDMGPGGPVERARVEVWSAGEPEGLRCVHESVLHVGSHGVRVGDQGGGMADLMLARGEYPLRVLVNADTPGLVSRVVFVLGPQRPPCPAMSVRDRRKLSLRFAVLGAGRVKMDNGG
jgi:hypothetical protein